jgi:hypothetical protein
MHAYARAPGTQELQAAQELLRDERAARPDAEPATREAAAFGALAHALFSTKEFVFLR